MSAGGLVLNSTYPYLSGTNGVTGTCKSTLITAANKKVTVTAVNSIAASSESAMAAYVQNTGPLIIYVNAANWNSYVGGIMTTASCGGNTINDLDHAVQAVGIYIDSTNAAKSYWKVRVVNFLSLLFLPTD